MDKIIKRHNPQNEKEVLDKYKDVVGKCPECGNDLIVRYSRFGSFVACSNYPQCKYIQSDKNLSKTNNDKGENDSISKQSNEEKFEKYSGQFKKGKREDIDDEVRSSWEANITRLLNYLKIDYSYETDSFRLITLNNRYKLASPSYLPDYILNDGTIIEVKGHLSARSLANMKAFQELYPNEKIKVIDNDIYYLIDKKYSEIVPNWEKTQNSPMQDIDVVGIKIKERVPFVAKLNEGDELILERDSNNKYDKNAIKVLDSDKHHIGYIDSFYACYLAPKLDLGIEYTMKLKHKKDDVLKCSIKSSNLDSINIKDFLEFL